MMPAPGTRCPECGKVEGRCIDLDAIRERAEKWLPPYDSEYPINEERLALDVVALVGRIQELEAHHDCAVCKRNDERTRASWARAVKAEAERDAEKKRGDHHEQEIIRLEDERDTLRAALLTICETPHTATHIDDAELLDDIYEIARAALTQGAGEEQERKAREEAEFEVRRRQRSNGWRNV